MKSNLGNFFQAVLWGLLWVAVFKSWPLGVEIIICFGILVIMFILARSGKISPKGKIREAFELSFVTTCVVYLVLNEQQYITLTPRELIMLFGVFTATGILLNIGHVIGAGLNWIANFFIWLSGQPAPSLDRKPRQSDVPTELDLTKTAAQRRGYE